MTEKSDNRTIEEIKARIDYCRNAKTAEDCMSCPYGEDADVCASDFMFDSFDYMQYLESELAKARKDVDILGEQVVALDDAYNAMKRERDAAVEQLRRADKENLLECTHCKHNVSCSEILLGCDVCDNSECPCSTCVDLSNWQWRGVEVE